MLVKELIVKLQELTDEQQNMIVYYDEDVGEREITEIREQDIRYYMNNKTYCEKGIILE